jgi:hypothetical protein
MKAIDAHKQALTEKFNSGLGIYPLAVLHQYAMKAEYTTEAERQAARITHTASWMTSKPGLNTLLDSFEFYYRKNRRLTVQALKILLECPPDPTYEEWKRQQKAR